MATLALVVENTTEQLQDYRLMKTLRRLHLRAQKRATIKWTATIEHMMDNPGKCPKCHR